MLDQPGYHVLLVSIACVVLGEAVIEELEPGVLSDVVGLCQVTAGINVHVGHRDVGVAVVEQFGDLLETGHKFSAVGTPGGVEVD